MFREFFLSTKYFGEELNMNPSTHCFANVENFYILV